MFLTPTEVLAGFALLVVPYWVGKQYGWGEAGLTLFVIILAGLIVSSLHT